VSQASTEKKQTKKGNACKKRVVSPREEKGRWGNLGIDSPSTLPEPAAIRGKRSIESKKEDNPRLSHRGKRVLEKHNIRPVKAR